MIFRVSSIARSRAPQVARRFASSEVSKASASSGGLNAFAQGWYNLYVINTLLFLRDADVFFCLVLLFQMMKLLTVARFLLIFDLLSGSVQALPDMPRSWLLEWL